MHILEVHTGDMPADEYARVSSEVANAEGEVERYETLLREASNRRKAAGEPEPPPAPPPASPAE